jgi:hypothetical protein
VVIPRGTEMNESVVARLTASKVDMDKMVRTQYVGDGVQGAVVQVSTPRKRGRPKKTK